MRDLTLVMDPTSPLDNMEVIRAVASSDALLSGALLTHLILFPRLHFARVCNIPDEVIGPKVLTAAAFGGFDASAFDAQGSVIGLDPWRFRARCHTYVGAGMEEGEVEAAWPAWKTTLPVDAQFSFALAIDTGLFSDLPADASADGSEPAMNYSDLLAEHQQYGSTDNTNDEDAE
jgi:hypothetical protein